MNRFDLQETALPYFGTNLPNRQGKAISQSPLGVGKPALLAILPARTDRQSDGRLATRECANHCSPDAAAYETRLRDPHRWNVQSLRRFFRRRHGVARALRSEERRVGKECRTRW